MDGAIDPKMLKINPLIIFRKVEDIVKATIGHQQNTIPEGRIIMDDTGL